ncbi:MAG: ADP compounds hydrolase NudE [Gammaproteobacteria bacterium]|nr:ADP compounds hydrolase NudE [Gammaproteobacteria bacterium]
MSGDETPDPRPQVLARREVARSRLFRIEELDLRFSNGVERTYERLPATGHRAVMVVAVDDTGEVLLIREYMAGFHAYQLTLPKGAADPGESLEDAANRELQEEAGFGARRIELLKELSVAPGHMGFTQTVALATGLYPSSMPGDEPEPLEVSRWPLADIDGLFAREDFCEARAIAALHLARMRLDEVAVKEARPDQRAPDGPAA